MIVLHTYPASQRNVCDSAVTKTARDIFSKAQRPVLREVLQQLEDRGTRYEPLLLKLFPPETRPHQREVLIEMYRKGKIAEAFRAFKKIYLEIVGEVIDHLKKEQISGD